MQQKPLFGYDGHMKNNQPIYIVIGLLAIIGGLFAWYALTPGRLDAFATCLGEKGATFYGAFWCPHCQAQKQMFGKSKDKLPYMECSTPDGQGQLAVCTDAGVTNYPTWVFADGTRVSGEQQLPALAEKTGCELPA